MQRSIRYILKGIGILLFIWILLQIDLDQAIESARHATPSLLVVGFLLFPVIYGIKSWRWHVLTKQAGITPAFQESAHVYIASLFLGIVTPGRIGEAFKIPWLRRRGLDMIASITVTVVDRLLDILAIALLSIAAVGILFGWEYSIIGLLVFCIIGILLWVSQRWKKYFPQIRLVTPYKYRWHVPCLLTLLNWTIYFLQMYLLAQAFSLQIPLLPFLASITIAGVVSMLPIAPAGLGTRDATLVLLFSGYGIASTDTVAFSFSVFLLTICASLIGAYFWIWSKHVHN